MRFDGAFELFGSADTASLSVPVIEINEASRLAGRMSNQSEIEGIRECTENFSFGKNISLSRDLNQFNSTTILLTQDLFRIQISIAFNDLESLIDYST